MCFSGRDRFRVEFSNCRQEMEASPIHSNACGSLMPLVRIITFKLFICWLQKGTCLISQVARHGVLHLTAYMMRCASMPHFSLFFLLRVRWPYILGLLLRHCGVIFVLILTKAATVCGNPYLARSLLLTISPGEGKSSPSLHLVMPHWCQMIRPWSIWEAMFTSPFGPAPPSPVLHSLGTSARRPSPVSSPIPRIFIEAVHTIIDIVPSSWKTRMLRHYCFLEIITDHQVQGSHPQKGHS